MHFTRTLIALFLCFGLALPAMAQKKDAPKKKITYDDHIKPIFRAKCFGCHNPDKKSSDLDLTTYDTAMGGGSSGAFVEPGDVESSYVWSLVTHQETPFMPPKQEKLPKATLDIIKAWIEGGALENAGSKFTKKKNMFNLALKTAPGQRPKEPAMPKRLALEPVLKTPIPGAVTALATSPWSPLVAVAGQKQILLYNTKTTRLVGVLPFPEGTANVLKFSSNGGILIAGGGRSAFRGLVVGWNVKTGERVFQIGEEVDSVMGADISSDHSLVAMGSSPKVIRVYSTTGEAEYSIAKKHTDWITGCSFSPDGVLLATSDRSGGLFVWEADTGREYLRLGGHSGAITAMSWRGDSNLLATSGLDGRVRLWEMENGRLVKNWSAHGGGVQSVEFCRDGNLVSCGRDRVTKLWNQNGGQIRAFAAFSEMALAVTYCDETKKVVAGDLNGAIKVWTAGDGKEAGAISVNPPSLSERVSAATAAVGTTKAAADKATAAYTAAKAAADKVVTDLTANKKLTTELQTKINVLAAKIKASKTAMTKLAAEQTAANKQATALAPVVAGLTTTLAQGQQTAAKATADKELAAVVQQVKGLLAKRTATLNQAKALAAAKAKEIDVAKKLLAAAPAQTKQMQATLATYVTQAAALAKASKPAADAAAKAKAAADAAQAQYVNATKDLERWKGEVQFAAKLKTLTAKQAEYEQLAAQAEDAQKAVTAVQSEITKLNAAVTAADAKHKAAVAASAKDKAAVATATTAHATAKKAADTLAASIPLLKDALAKSQDVATKLKGDKEVAAIVTQLKASHDKKVAALAPAQKAAAAKAAELLKVQQTAEANLKAMTTLASTLTAAQKQAAAKTASLKPLQAKATAAKQAADGANKTFSTLQKELDALRGA